MRHLFTRAFFALLCAFALQTFAVTAEAQFKASIQGTVNDTSGAVVSGVKITVTNTETGKSQETVTGDEGFYRVGGLAPGIYDLTAELTGFKKNVIRNIAIHAEEAQGVNITLATGPVSESVTVSATAAEAAQIQTEIANVDRAITT